MKIAFLTTDNREHWGEYSCSNPGFGAAPEALLQGFQDLPELEVHVVSCTRRPMDSPAKLAPNIWFHSLKVPRLGWLRTGYLGCIRAVRKKLRELSPDLVHGQGTERDCAISAAFGGFPNVLTIHGNMRAIARAHQARPFSYFWLTAQLERFVLPRTDGVVCITNYTHHAVQNLALRTWVVPNAVDQSFFELTPRSNGTDSPTGLCVGDICRHKNQNDFIRALDPLAGRRKFKMTFLGRPDASAYGCEFRQLIAERPWCEYAGFADRSALKRHLQSAAFIVLPSWEDNCPMAVLEAMAAGVPVLASNIGGIPDLIQPEATGLLCDPRQPETFHRSVLRLLEEPALSQNLAAAARAEARRRFHPHVVARRHLEIYREVLAGTARF